MHAKEQFFSLTSEIALDAIDALGMKTTGRMLQLNSLENRVYEIEIEDKEGATSLVVAKFYRPLRWSKQQIQDEHDFLFELEASDIPVVAPIKNKIGESVLELPNLEMFGAIFPKKSGRLEPESSDEDLAKIGRLIGRMHAVGSRKKEVTRPKVSSQWFLKSNYEFVLEFIPKEILSTYDSVLGELEKFCKQKLNEDTFIRVHGDLHRGNIIWRADEGPVLVDFDDFLLGPPVQDFWLLVSGRDEESQRQLDLIISGYEMFREFDYESLSLIELLRTLRMVLFAGWISKRADDPSFKRAFPQFWERSFWDSHIRDLQDQISVI